MRNVKFLLAAFIFVVSVCGSLIAQARTVSSGSGVAKLAPSVTAQEIAENGTFDGSIYRNKLLGFS
ncbi:MAG TPA: hypothetical protein VGJ02_00440, partial [Pyrinomonadaceae bacterium]